MNPTGEGPRGPSPVRVVVVVCGFALGALFAIGSVLAALFEAQHFGSRDNEIRAGYVAALAAGLVVSVVSPFVLWRLLLPSAPRSALALGAIALVLAFALFGLALRS